MCKQIEPVPWMFAEIHRIPEYYLSLLYDYFWGLIAKICEYVLLYRDAKLCFKNLQ